MTRWIRIGLFAGCLSATATLSHAFSIGSIYVSSFTIINAPLNVSVEMREEFGTGFVNIGRRNTPTLTVVQSATNSSQLIYNRLSPNRRFVVRMGQEEKTFYTRPAFAGELPPEQAFTNVTCTSARFHFMNSELPGLANPTDPANPTKYWVQMLKTAPNIGSVTITTTSIQNPPLGVSSDRLYVDFPSLEEQTQYIATVQTIGREPNSNTATRFKQIGFIEMPACQASVALNTDAATVSETAGVVTLRFERTTGLGRRMQIGWSVLPETAEAGSDFEAIASSMTVLEPSEPFKTISIRVFNDELIEGDETFRVKINNVDNGSIGSPSETVITLTSNDRASLISFRNSLDDVIESDGPRHVWVDRSGNENLETRIEATLAPGGTAVEGVDFTFTPQILTFRPGGVNEAPVFVQIKNNTVLDRQNPRYLFLQLKALDSNSVIQGNRQVIMHIYDDEQTPLFEFGQTAYTVAENGQFVDVEVIQKNPLGPASVVMSVNLPESTAQASSDYLNFPARLQFTNGESSKIVRIPILNDLTQEPTEYIRLYLNNPTDDAQLGRPDFTKAQIEILDNDGPGQMEDDIFIRQPARATDVVNDRTQLSIIAETGLTGGLTYEWKQLAGIVGGSTIADPHASVTDVTFTKTGRYTFEVTLRNGTTTLTKTSSIDVIDPVIPQTLEIQKPTIELRARKKINFVAFVTDQFGDRFSDEPVYWQTSRPTSAQFSGNSLTAFAPDTITITARTLNNLQDHLEVTILPANSQANFATAHAFPNPWKSSMGVSVITFTDLAAGTRLTIYTSTGREVKSYFTANGDDIPWPLINESGEGVASGVYLYRLERPGEKRSGKVFIIR